MPKTYTYELTKPRKVNTAVNLLYASLGIGVISSGLFPVGLDEVNSFGSALNDSLYTFFIFGLTLLLYYMIGKGKNWARITFLVFFIMGFPLSIVVLPMYLSLSDPPFISGILFLVQTGMDLVALVFLFQGESSAWFKAIKQSNAHMTETNAPID